jgi:thiamine-phosphate pyrophosphorylase
MVAGELGADYVMFGEHDSAGRRPSLQAILERVAWWAELFELPCVGFAGALGEVEPLARAGADFIAVGDFVFSDVRGCAAAAEVARRIADAEALR